MPPLPAVARALEPRGLVQASGDFRGPSRIATVDSSLSRPHASISRLGYLS